MVIALLCAGVAQAQDAAYRFAQDAPFTYTIEQTNMTLQEAPGQTSTFNSELTMRVTYQLLETLDNGNLKMQVTIDNALAINEGPNGTQTLGSDMAGKSVIFEMNGSGEVVDVDSSIRAIESEGAGLLAAATGIFPRLDGSKIREGASWDVTEMDTSGNETRGFIYEETERTYSVKGKKTVAGHECLEIALESEAESEGEMVNGDQELSVNGKRNGTATIMYASGVGIITSFEAELNTDQVIMLPAQNMRVPITATQNVKIVLVEN
jgi:hypothetical protein